MKHKLIILSGIPGSGKSRLARQLVKKNRHSTIIVNRDDIRSMLGDYWIPTREGLVTDIERNMIVSGLQTGYEVIVDATNLNPKTLNIFKKIANDEGVDIEYIKLQIGPKMAYLRILWRTVKRGRYISFKVINNFYNRYFKK